MWHSRCSIWVYENDIIWNSYMSSGTRISRAMAAKNCSSSSGCKNKNRENTFLNPNENFPYIRKQISRKCLVYYFEWNIQIWFIGQKLISDVCNVFTLLIGINVRKGERFNIKGALFFQGWRKYRWLNKLVWEFWHLKKWCRKRYNKLFNFFNFLWKS